MSERHQKRSRCVSCREGTWNQPTHVLLHRKLNRFGMWVPGAAVLCDTCQDTWWSLFTPPSEPVEDWIGLVDGRMWPRRHVDQQGPGVQQLLQELDQARHNGA